MGTSKFGGTKRGARYLEWLSLQRNFLENDFFYKDITAVLDVPSGDDFPANGQNNNEQLLFTTLLPEDIASGGDVTLVRLVGDIGTSYSDAAADIQGILTGLCTFTVQLAQVDFAAGVTTHMKFFMPGNAPAQEKSNIMWQQTFDYVGPTGYGNNSIFFNPATGNATVRNQWPLDIRVKRRWDRSQYRLIFTASFDVGFFAAIDSANNAGIMLNLRGLFLTQGGI